MVVHCGGDFVTLPCAKYNGEDKLVFDWVEAGSICQNKLKSYSDILGVQGDRRSIGFKLLLDDADIQKWSKEHISCTEMHVYVEHQIPLNPRQHDSCRVVGEEVGGEVHLGAEDESYDDSDSFIDSDFDVADESTDDDAMFDKNVDTCGGSGR